MRFKGEVLDGMKKLEEKGWDQIYDEARENILEMFENVEDGITDPKLEKKWDQAQRDWIKADKAIKEVLKKY
jgi:hypothetical protein